jgi:hypothetical protein
VLHSKPADRGVAPVPARPGGKGAVHSEAPWLATGCMMRRAIPT